VVIPTSVKLRADKAVFKTPQKRPDVVVSGIVIQDVREDTLVATIIDNGQNAEGPSYSSSAAT